MEEIQQHCYFPKEWVNSKVSDGLHGGIAGRKPVQSKKNVAAHLMFPQDYVDKPEAYWRNVLWIDESKIKLLNKKA